MATPEQAELIHDLSIASGNVAGAIEWGSGFVTAERQHREAVQALLAAFAQLNADNARLRRLINATSCGSDRSPGCPWCHRYCGRGHAPDCPAFTPEGVVK